MSKSYRKTNDQEKQIHPFIYVILITAIIVSSIMLSNLMKQRNNFDNNLLYGDYSGSLLPDNQPVFVLNATFDGEGNVNGTIKVGTFIQEYSTTYIVGGSDFKMTIYVNSTVTFQLIGDVIDEGMEVSGDLQMLNNDSIYNGTYSLLKLT